MPVSRESTSPSGNAWAKSSNARTCAGMNVSRVPVRSPTMASPAICCHHDSVRHVARPRGRPEALRERWRRCRVRHAVGVQSRARACRRLQSNQQPCYRHPPLHSHRFQCTPLTSFALGLFGSRPYRFGNPTFTTSLPSCNHLVVAAENGPALIVSPLLTGGTGADSLLRHVRIIALFFPPSSHSLITLQKKPNR